MCAERHKLQCMGESTPNQEDKEKKLEENQTKEETAKDDQAIEQRAKELLDTGYFGMKKTRCFVIACIVIVLIYIGLVILSVIQNNFFDIWVKPFIQALAAFIVALGTYFDWSVRNMNNTLDVMLSKDEADVIKKTDTYKERLASTEIYRAWSIIIGLILAVLGLA